MKPLYDDESWDVAIKWTKPARYEAVREEGSQYDEQAFLYLITARFSSKSRKVLYVGKTFKQWVSKRLSQPDHKRRYKKIVSDYSHHKFEVSHGLLTVSNGKLTQKRLSDIEKILIYSNHPSHAHNVQGFYAHGVSGSYRIENSGHRCGLPKCIALGVFIQT